jgi:hypothetical protein
MSHWYEMTQREIDASPEAQLKRAADYQDVFLGGHQGRAVFADIIRTVEASARATAEPVDPAFQLGMDSLLREINWRMGLRDHIRILAACLPIARSWQPDPQPSPKEYLEVGRNLTGRVIT